MAHGAVSVSSKNLILNILIQPFLDYFLLLVIAIEFMYFSKKA
jgi:hypothetical protein